MNVFKRAKFIAIIFLIIFFFFFTNDFNTVNIEKTALIVALGIDKAENEYEITVQIAVPEATDQSKANAESVISAKSDTLYSAVEKISEETGWHPRLSFCNLVLIGENMLSENIINVTDFFLRSYKIEDSAIICATEGSAKDVLLTTSPLDNISSFALTKIFVREFDNASAVVTSSIKNFAIGGYSKSKYGFLPYVKKVETEDKTDVKASAVILNSPNSATGGESGSNGDSSSGAGKKDKPSVFDATTTLLFHDGYCVGKLNKEESLFYSLITKQVSEAYFSIEAVDDSGNAGKYLVAVTDVKNKTKLTFEDSKPVFKGELSLWLKVVDSNATQDIKDYSNLGRLSKSMLSNAEKLVTEKLYSLFDKIKKSECDLFELTNSLYRINPKKYYEMGDKIKKETTAKFNVTCNNFS
ncbi:MAG: hypothetical protein J6R88_04185 [Clostridia bacterium]|nr:hypothetical protein [Clostridia bacterium]